MKAAPIVACVLLAGCYALPSMEPPVVERSAPSDPSRPARATPATPGGELVAYLARIRDLGEKPLAAETQRQRETMITRKSDLETVKLGLALLLSPTSEETEIANLMEPIARRGSADDDVRAMASFLLHQAAERRRLKEGAAAAGSRLRDERRAHEAQKQRADALQERAAQLQQKIDALTELEKSLSDRPVQTR
ncbi:MAG TPA: hypothetical protein VFV90_02895 [Usitatibacter sp.]|nr:hypothetical protein [Usitatibacter sp.]